MNSESSKRVLILMSEKMIVLLFPKTSVVINLSISALSFNPISKAEPSSPCNFGKARTHFRASLDGAS